MRYTKIVASSEIVKAQKLLSEVTQCGTKFQVKKINDIPDHCVYWFEEQKFWIDTARLIKKKKGSEENYFWNPCGITKPQGVNDALKITVQIGVDPVGNHKRSAVFLKDESGKIYLAHNGLVNTGNVRDKFDEQKFNKVEIASEKMILIGCLSSDSFIKNIADFVYEIDRLKKA